MAFWRRSKALFLFAIQQNLEYRFNYFIDAVAQPIIAAIVELTLWYAVFASSGLTTLGGFQLRDYLAYAFWAAFVSRLSTNWMYEFRMIEEIESGSINSLLVRPLSFYEYYLSQFMGYKAITIVMSLWVPLVAGSIIGFPILHGRIPAVLASLILYLIMVHTLSFCVACFAFKLTKVGSFTMAKNLALWVLSGELFPLDLLPEPTRSILIALPFSNAVYIPVGYLTGRLGFDLWLQGVLSTMAGILVFGLIARGLWQKGVREYAGTGA